MIQDLGETVCLVTGANRGIGREVCRQLAGRGRSVVLTARWADAAATAAHDPGPPAVSSVTAGRSPGDRSAFPLTSGLS